MKIGFFNFYETYNNNKMFKDPSSSIGDDLMYPFVKLYETARSKGLEISTIDTEPLDTYDLIFFADFPTLENKYFKELIKQDFDNLYLILLESELIRPDNWDRDNHSFFKKVFTWHDGYVDNKKYFKFYLPNRIPKSLKINLNSEKKLCTNISGNKFVSHPLELYSERVNTIRWFEKNHPDDFDLFGINWDKHLFEGFLAPLNKFGFLNGILKSNYPSYRGSVESKFETLQGYKFSICYENARDIPGYITEKIFDCFFAGCVPIYWGAPNITDYIPPDTFIDRRNFKTYSELYDYINNMPLEEYESYLKSIKEFVNGKKIFPFSSEFFVDTILNEI